MKATWIPAVDRGKNTLFSKLSLFRWSHSPYRKTTTVTIYTENRDRSETKEGPSSLMKAPTTEWCLKTKENFKAFERAEGLLPSLCSKHPHRLEAQRKKDESGICQNYSLLNWRPEILDCKSKWGYSDSGSDSPTRSIPDFPHSLCQNRLLWITWYSSTDKKFVHNQGLKS